MSRRWNHACDADVVIRVGMMFDRYRSGEVVVEPVFRYSDGSEWTGGSHRVALAKGYRRAIPLIWEMLFDEVLRVQRLQPRSLSVELAPMDVERVTWATRMATVVDIVGHELAVPVGG
jgi:hypothetical protein